MCRCNGNQWECDSCHESCCDKHIVCDVCGDEEYDTYYEIGGMQLCENCMKAEYEMNIN